MSSTSLSGRVALVTGGGTGIGLMIAKAFAVRGAKVYITGRRLEILEKAATFASGTDGSLVALQLDVTSESSIQGAANAVKANDGKLDILVNNAGISTPLKNNADFLARKMTGSDIFEPELMSDWMDVYKLNTVAPFFVIRGFRELLIQGAQLRGANVTSSVINISSTCSVIRSVIVPSCMAYPSSKAAVDQITVMLATYYATNGMPIRVNAIQPGIFPSELTENADREMMETFTSAPLPGYTAVIPAKRLGDPEEMGSAAAFLATSEFTNGVLLRLDGGLFLVNP